MLVRATRVCLFRHPKNLGVAPRHDTWREKYEAWAHLRRMGRIVGTGFYIPPEWYNHFRMFPPIQHNFREEETLNPHNDSEPTQSQADNVSAARRAVREELARSSRSLASDGMRYFNLFWVEKSLDKAERSYLHHKRRGLTHDEALRAALEEYYSEAAVKMRVQTIQSEEARLTGAFITMREATAVLNVLSHVQTAQLAPHHYSELAETTRQTVQQAPFKRGRIVESRKKRLEKARAAKTAAAKAAAAEAAAAAAAAEAAKAAKASAEGGPADGAPAPTKAATDAPSTPTTTPTTSTTTTSGAPTPADGGNAEAEIDADDSASEAEMSAELLHADLQPDEAVLVEDTRGSESLAHLRETATDKTGVASWYTGDSPRYSQTSPQPSKPTTR